jgi:hypothetical protein
MVMLLAISMRHSYGRVKSSTAAISRREESYHQTHKVLHHSSERLPLLGGILMPSAVVHLSVLQFGSIFACTNRGVLCFRSGFS